jgi:RNA polymerase Rpb2, domain 2
MESSTRSTSTMTVKMLSRAGAKGGGGGQCIRATVPYVRSDVPILIIFRALGFVVRAQPSFTRPSSSPVSIPVGAGRRWIEATGTLQRYCGGAGEAAWNCRACCALWILVQLAKGGVGTQRIGLVVHQGFQFSWEKMGGGGPELACSCQSHLRS